MNFLIFIQKSQFLQNAITWVIFNKIYDQILCNELGSLIYESPSYTWFSREASSESYCSYFFYIYTNDLNSVLHAKRFVFVNLELTL